MNHDEPRFQPTRRSFLKLAGFSTGGALLAGCTGGLETKAIPYLVKPEEITPGRAEWYATLCGGCDAGCGVLAKRRDGRPIKIEGNPEHPLSRGGVCAVGQAQILSLYDARRSSGPREGNRSIAWAEADRLVRDRLVAIADAGGAIRLLTARTSGPTDQREIRRFLDAFPTARHVTWTPLSTGAIARAHQTLTGAAVVPRHRFENADTIVSFDADFLGAWISPVEHTRGWSEGRARSEAFSNHTHFESRLSLTGAKADRRIVVAPTEMTAVMLGVAARVLRARGLEVPWSSAPTSAVSDATLDEVAGRLLRTMSGRALVVSGSTDPLDQGVVALLNHALGSTGKNGTLDLEHPSRQAPADDAAFVALRADLAAGAIDALIVARVNPVYDHADGTAFAKSLDATKLVVSLADRVDETAAHAHFVLPEPHALATWTDAEPVDGMITLGQPAIRPLGDQRALAATLAAWRGDARPIDALVREAWRESVLPRRRGGGMGFGAFWDRAVHDGFVEVEAVARPVAAPDPAKLGDVPEWPKPADGALTLIGYAKVGLRDGSGAENPWLQELPDPISKTAWDNYACLAPETASNLGVSEGDLVWVELDDDHVVRLPVLVQPGQHRGTVAVAIGYGRKGTARFADVAPDWIEGRPTLGENGRVGVDIRPLMRGAFPAVEVSKANGNRPLARTQTWHSLDVPDIVAEDERRRPCVQETTVADWKVHAQPHGPPASQTLWSDDHPYEGRHWNLVVDLTRCTGCAACVVSCQVENNIPVVGYDEVRRQRIMHWLRIDRYYTGEGDDVATAQQPMLCQHCDDAPCETVCPVLATVHGSEGLNQQVYNRCVGTRYCSNNCPYKVRRFNWFDYRHDDPVENMALNPDVAVRSRGVMEKCSFCVQRIAEAKAEAKREGRPLVDGDVMPACVQSCPSSALTFGDGNDPESAVAKAHQDPRHYRVLEELGVRPSVGYLALVRNDGKGEGR